MCIYHPKMIKKNLSFPITSVALKQCKTFSAHLKFSLIYFGHTENLRITVPLPAIHELRDWSIGPTAMQALHNLIWMYFDLMKFCVLSCSQYSPNSLLAVRSKKIKETETLGIRRLGLGRIQKPFLEQALEASVQWGSASGRAEAGVVHAQLVNHKGLVRDWERKRRSQPGSSKRIWHHSWQPC